MKKNSNIHEQLSDWTDALENLMLFDGKEDASELIQNFVKYKENKGLLESSFADLPLKILFLNLEKLSIQVIGMLKKN